MSLINFQSKLKNAIHKNDIGMATIIATAHHWLGHRLGHGHSRWRESTRVGVMMQVRPLAGPSARACACSLQGVVVGFCVHVFT